MTVYGDGKQTRSFQYVSDLVSLGYSATFFSALGKERAFFLQGFVQIFVKFLLCNYFIDPWETSQGTLNSRKSDNLFV